MLDGNDRGRFVWYDLMTSDPGKAQPFYQQVAGWGTQPFNSDYSMWTVNGKPIGGVMDLPRAGVPPHWIGYVAVPDVDAAVRQTESLGGKAHVPGTDIPNVGRFAILADPQGAVFAVFAGNAPEQGDKPVAGDFSWHELATTDYKAAFAFYQALVGWETIAEHDMGPMGIYFIFGRNGTQLGGMFNKPTEMPWPPNWLRIADCTLLA